MPSKPPGRPGGSPPRAAGRPAGRSDARPGARPDQRPDARGDKRGDPDAKPGPKRPAARAADRPTGSFTPRGGPARDAPRPAPDDAAPRAPKPTRAAPRDRKAGPRPSRPRDPAEAPRLGQPRPPRPDPAPAAPPPTPPPPAREPTAATLRAPAAPPRTDAPPAGPRPPAAPRGSVWLHGLHPVAAALANPNRRPRRLLLTEEAEATLRERFPQPWPLAAERADRAKLDGLLGRDTVHQGAGLLADLLSPPALSAVLERPGPVLVLDQVTDPRNIGAVLRSAAAFGAAAVIMQDRNTPEETGVLAKAASGALETMPLLRAVNLSRTLVALKAAGLWVIGLDAAGEALRGVPLAERRVALVLGAEGAGLRRLTRDTCDEMAGLAMPGTMESLNVSAAAAIALYELTRKA
jgi:23S rRNA (guanosine2251-2'-O)-methyltransferase